jgi:hypothetical protein
VRNAVSLRINQSKQRSCGFIRICLERAFCTDFAIEEGSILTFELRVVFAVWMAAFPWLVASAGVRFHISRLWVYKYHPL